MEKLQSIKILLIRRADSNVREKGFDDPGFNDLVASIKEKGVLVPIIVRRTVGYMHKAYEVVAGNRRFSAAKKLGLEKIPAIIRELTDTEAKEVQIIENLQRLDVHPLDEGLAYRQLIEKSKYTIEDVAIKVGKSQDYIRQRLFLTNLTEKPANFYRKGKITNGHAVLIAKLSPNDQAKSMKYLREEWELPSVKEFKKWIEQTFYHPLSFQPWLNNTKANIAVGKCVECEPDRNTLFGEIKIGACTDLKCWKRKMENYVKYQIAEAKQKGIELLRISKNYSYSPRGKVEEGILTRNHYEPVSFKKKEQCKYAQKAIVAVDENMGTFMWVCISPKCQKHHQQHSNYALTDKEKKARRKEAKRQKAKREKEEERTVKALNKIKWPLNKKALDIIFEMTLQGQGTSVLRPVAKRFGIKPKKKISFGSTYYDWEASIKEAEKKMKNAEKLRFIIGVMLERTWGNPKNKIIKTLLKEK